jgi:hypothetical protein
LSIVSLVAVLLIFQTIYFGYDYFYLYPEKTKQPFYYGVDQAITKIDKIAVGQKILVTNELTFNYLYIATFTQLNPVEFQTSDWKQVNGGYEIVGFKNYLFVGSKEAEKLIQNEKKYYYLYQVGKKPCKNNHVIEKIENWEIGKCSSK